MRANVEFPGRRGTAEKPSAAETTSCWLWSRNKSRRIKQFSFQDARSKRAPSSSTAPRASYKDRDEAFGHGNWSDGPWQSSRRLGALEGTRHVARRMNNGVWAGRWDATSSGQREPRPERDRGGDVDEADQPSRAWLDVSRSKGKSGFWAYLCRPAWGGGRLECWNVKPAVGSRLEARSGGCRRALNVATREREMTRGTLGAQREQRSVSC